MGRLGWFFVSLFITLLCFRLLILILKINFNQITFEFCCKDVIQEYHGLLLVKMKLKILLTLSIALHGVLKNSEKMDYSFKFNPILKIVFRYIICIPSQLFLLVIRSHIMTQHECFPFVIF